MPLKVIVGGDRRPVSDRSFMNPANQPAEADETPSTPAPPPLTREQLMRIRQLAYDEALRLRLAEAKAGLLADSLVGGLVVSPA